MPGDGDQQPRPGPRKRPPDRPGDPAQQHDDRPTRPRAPGDERSRAGRGGPPPAGKKVPAKKAPPEKTPGKKAPGKKAPAKKTAAKRAPAEKAPPRKTAGKKAPATKAPATRPPAKRAGAEQAGATRPPAGSTARPTRAAAGGQAAPKQTPPTKGPAKKTAGKKAPPEKTAAEKAPTKKTAAKKAPAKQAGAPGAVPAQARQGRRPPTERDAARREAPGDRATPGGRAPARRRPPASGPTPEARRRPAPDQEDRTAAVPAAELFAPESPDVVVRPADAPDHPAASEPPEPSGPVDLAAGAPLVAPEDEPPAPPAWPEVAPEPEPEAARPPRQKKLRGKAKRIHKARQRPPSRLLNHYDVNGPRIRLGFLWFVTVGFAIAAETAVDLPFLALLYGGAAGFAGWQAAREWRKREDRGAVPWAAAAGAAAIGIAGGFSPGAVGVAIGLAAGLAVAGALVDPLGREEVPGSLALTLQCGLFAGIAAASIPLVWRVEPGAAITLFLLVSAYEVGDYVVGSGSLNAFEGPIAGILAVAAVMLPLYAVQLPPIDSDTVVLYGAIVALGCPLSQIVGSAVLPWSDAPAPALRRLDSLMLTGPAWLVAIWLENGVL